MKKHYIKAVIDLLLQGKDVSDVLKDLQKVLKAKGHFSIYPQILSGLVSELGRATESTSATVTVADEADVAKLKVSIEASLKELEGSLSDASVQIDPTLIGGYIASHKGKSINRSYKQKLVTLYRSITA